MFKTLLLSTAAVLFSVNMVNAEQIGQLLIKTDTTNVVTSKILSLDYEMAGDVNYRISLPDPTVFINWNPSDTTQKLRNFVGAEIVSYLNFTIKAEVMQRTKQQLTLSLVPFRVYPVVDYFTYTRTVSSGAQAVYNRVSAFINLGEIHTLYYNNWKSCGNTFVNNDGTNNFDDAFLLEYCGYNTETETVSEDSTIYLPNLYGARWTKEIKFWEVTQNY